jgi:polar amino acid transport system substrate-binding protein
MKLRTWLVVLVLVGVAAACAAEPSQDTATKASRRALVAVNEEPITTTTVPPTSAVPCDPADPTRSLAPAGALPTPGHMRTGTFMRKIQDRGYLIAGVDQNTKGFGYRDASGNIEGFDIDMLREVARAIFGTPDAIQFRAVTSAQRVGAITNNEVDIVASLMSITCERWQVIDFSTEYYAARQRVLVRADSPIQRVTDLNGQKVCATKGSTSIDQIRKFAPKALPYGVDLRTECLVVLQEGLVNAVTADDTILYGLKSQDAQETRLLPDTLHQPEPYGMGISQEHPEFVRFVNAVLEQMRTDGRWKQYHRTLETQLGIPPANPPAPEYKS